LIIYDGGAVGVGSSHLSIPVIFWCKSGCGGFGLKSRSISIFANIFEGQYTVNIFRVIPNNDEEIQ